MTLSDFKNTLRILSSIDEYELAPLGWARSKRDEFFLDPVRFLLVVDDKTSDQLWAIITARQPVARKLEVVK
jgi:hypothetical protein